MLTPLPYLPSPLEEPLVTYGEAHPELAGHDGYIPAFQMVLAHYSKHVWRRLMTTLSFEKIDIDGDGTLTREEIQRALEQVQGVQVAQVRKALAPLLPARTNPPWEPPYPYPAIFGLTDQCNRRK